MERDEADRDALHRAGDPDPAQAAQAFLRAARHPDLAGVCSRWVPGGGIDGWSKIRLDHPARHGKDVAPFLRELGLWWGDLMMTLRLRAVDGKRDRRTFASSSLANQPTPTFGEFHNRKPGCHVLWRVLQSTN